MKKIFLLASVTIGLLLFHTANAQKEDVTAKNASKSRAYTKLNESGTITIYKYQHGSHAPKDAERYLPLYFYTTASSDVLQPLSKLSLKKAFQAITVFMTRWMQP